MSCEWRDSLARLDSMTADVSVWDSSPPGLTVGAKIQMGVLDQSACLALDECSAHLSALERMGDPGLLAEIRRHGAKRRSSSKWVQDWNFRPSPALFQTALSIKARLRLGVMVVAVHRYRLDHNGSHPQGLAELVPRYLKQLPVDPFTGDPATLQSLSPGMAIGFGRSPGSTRSGASMPDYKEPPAPLRLPR